MFNYFSCFYFQRRSGLHLTHVTFSPNGDEVLLSYSGEHVYLMDVNSGTLLILWLSLHKMSQICIFAYYLLDYPSTKENKGIFW